MAVTHTSRWWSSNHGRSSTVAAEVEGADVVEEDVVAGDGAVLEEAAEDEAVGMVMVTEGAGADIKIRRSKR